MNETRWERYVDAALRTEKDRTPKSYLAHGLCFVGEIPEVREAEDQDHLIREVGDVWWYLAVLSHGMSEIRGCPNQLRPSLNGEYREPVADPAFELVEIVEDVAFQDDEPSDSWFWSVQSLFGEITSWLADQTEVEAYDIWEENVDKLAERHDV